MKLVAPKGAVWWKCARAFNLYVYSPSVSSSLSVSNSFSSMSSSSISGLSSVKTASSSVLSIAFEIPQVLKEFLTISSGISAHAVLIQRRTRFLLGAFFLPAGVNSNGPDIIHAKYFRRTLSLKGLLRHLSKGYKTGVRPPGIIATSMFRWFRSPFTESVKWARNESYTRRELSPRGKLCLIHSLTPCSSIQPFLWKETRRGWGTTRSLGVRTPLKMTFGGTFVPSAATARTTVKLCFSAPQDFTGTVRLPLNSNVRFDGTSKRIGVSSILGGFILSK